VLVGRHGTSWTTNPEVAGSWLRSEKQYGDFILELEYAINDGGNSGQLFRCGFTRGVPPGYEAQIRPRSGLALKSGLTLLNTPGTIDADYRGEVGVIVVNHGAHPVTIARGDRIAQLVILALPDVELVGVDDLPETSRGAGGFGHTGVR